MDLRCVRRIALTGGRSTAVLLITRNSRKHFRLKTGRTIKIIFAEFDILIQKIVQGNAVELRKRD